jgi:hypothetical protein
MKVKGIYDGREVEVLDIINGGELIRIDDYGKGIKIVNKELIKIKNVLGKKNG